MAAAQWISVAEAAKILQKSERTVRRQCEGGKLLARQESTLSGRAWMVCLEPVESVAEGMADDVTEGEIETPSSTRSEEATATGADRNEAAAIVPTLEMRVSTAAATSEANTLANSEVLAEVSELRQNVEQIKAYLVGQNAAEMREALAALPSRDDIREDLTTVMSAALTPVMNRLEELAGENAQLQAELHAEKQKALAQVRRPWWKKLFS